ncbi:Asp-tRNA(Asn)/Glu-tRNA(Gln) amidotransferase subunit GatC [Synechococcales cyanobacterium C]|uniref:Aspartyl/glutamyl-tRNA(Asn/Gln) amidotransferase subunit C n=1 Tax=Petrachloros mirabilis ULC683 TaxID=2781853 RepID=A0A8K1ZYA9_9CYAN|nr:Asp-tRNA(Asn)/Glu-tRNA(Gln) amidotransferase subunit GatC [Petrachloros mirabilis]NCJ07098.1 Asp-tRNA(Asn)/Glu-tRNA(Gln) amidotransferase subunit GatC [Petrachloros mirabilis ULC683]
MIGQQDVQKVAHLARLTLTPAEEAQFTTQLGAILEYVEQLNELDVTTVEPTTRAIDVSNITRPDQQHPHPNRAQILAGAPDPEGDFFRVPKIMDS